MTPLRLRTQRLQQVHRAHHIHTIKGQGVIVAHKGQSGQVQHGVEGRLLRRLLHGLLHRRGVTQVGVQRPHRMPGALSRCSKVAASKAVGAGQQDAHGQNDTPRSTRRRSACTIIWHKFSKEVWAVQPRAFWARVASPTSRSTSAGR